MFVPSLLALLAVVTAAIATPIEVMTVSHDGQLTSREFVDDSIVYAQRPGNESSWVSQHSQVNATGHTLIAYNLNFDCGAGNIPLPEICANVCYYVYCKGGNFQQTRKSGRTVAAECKKSPNKCSTKSNAPGGAFPHSDYQCDEYPMASTTDGGIANVATRCLPAQQNRSAGGKLNGVPVGQTATTVLINPGSAPFYCERYGNPNQHTTNCHPAGDDKRQA
ncbi:hypothetical protein PLICRDRAFT_56077 [Plicaturopsis crispa FD-325 SS-3]|nr:hypothetical protein PLICRDRAFT_56077 [Plicaturopsis crispa FD-325 SS-3]